MTSHLGPDTASEESARPRRARGLVAAGAAAAFVVTGAVVGVDLARGDAEPAPTAAAATSAAPSAAPTKAAAAPSAAPTKAVAKPTAAKATASKPVAKPAASTSAAKAASPKSKASQEVASARSAMTASRSKARVVKKANESPRQTGRRLASAKGWGGQQFACLDKLWTKESDWTVTADNPTSDAYGIPQALPGSKMASAGAGWRNDAETQIRWGLSYIDDVYGTPCSAWAHSRATNWY